MGSSSRNLGQPAHFETLPDAHPSGGNERALRFVLLGEGLALAGAMERLRRKGHVVVGIVACSEAEGQAMLRVGLPVCVKPVDPAGFITDLEFDVLLSINNGYLIRAETLALARVASINYHNAPLPAYAGLRATAWAVLNGEPSHGITWHHIDPHIDTGMILVQRHFALEPTESTASLNLRCTVVALESFAEVLACLEEGRIEGRPQDLTGRSYFRRTDTVPGAGLIDWRWPGEHIVRLVRACDWGNVANNFGSAAFVVPREPARFVRSATRVAGAGLPGLIMACEGDTATVACSDGAIKLTLFRADGLEVGAVLPPLHEAEFAEAGAIHRRALLSEHRWFPKLRRLQTMSSSASAPGTSREFIACDGNWEEFLLAVERVLGADTLVAIETQESGFGLTQKWMPIRANEGLLDSMAPLLRDIAHRRPELHHAGDWLSSVSVRIYRYSAIDAMDRIPPGTIAFGVDGGVHSFGAQALARAVLRCMRGEVDAEVKPSDPECDVETILTMVTEQASAEPDAAAIDEESGTTTRGELLQRADRLARHLVAAGLQKEDGVGILLAAGANFVVGALAAMRAGAAYVPLAPASPANRLAVEVGEAGIQHIVTDHEHKDQAQGLGIPFTLVDESSLPEHATVRLPHVYSSDCAYRIFTSGSTGKPKAVEITHGALANLINHYLLALPMQRSDRMTMLANPIFDASVADIWPILAAGGTLVVPPPRILLHLSELIDWLAQTAITCTFVTTPVAERLLKMPWPSGIALHTLLTGGDTLHSRPPAGLPFRLINTYGPTENTVDSLWAVVDPGQGRPPIGRPITGVTAFVADQSGQPLLPGEVGELLLGGAQLARGYRGQPTLTSAKFVADLSRPGLCSYRTGDQARVNEAGEFEFLGRIDHQVQILGRRVEPEEIEAVLMRDGRVAEAVCVPTFHGKAVTGLAVCVVAAKKVHSDGGLEDALHRVLAEHLPSEIRPKTIKVCDDLPRTPAGKVDRRALIELMNVTDQSGAAEEARTVAEIWNRLLPGAAGGSGEETFWELGGDSLGAMSLLLEVETLTKVRVPIAYFLTEPTLKGLIRLTTERAFSTVVQLREGSGVPLVCWHTLSGDLETYQHLADQLGERPIFGIISSSVAHDAGPAPSMEKIVSDGLAELKRIGMEEAPAMVGYSWGGLLAFEAARQLTLAGMPPPYVGLIGTTPPITRRSRATRLLHFLRWGPKRAWKRIFRKRSGASEETLRDSLRRAARLLLSNGIFPETRSWKVPLAEAHVRLGFAYHPRTTVPVKLHLFRDVAWRHYRDHLGYVRYDKPDFGWDQWAGIAPTLTWVDGRHDNIMLGESVHKIARQIETHLDAAR